MKALRRIRVCVGAVAVLSACSPNHLQAVELDSDTLSRQLLAHWPFDEQTGTVAHDESGSQPPRDGQLTGGTWLTDGQFSGALHLSDGEFVSVARFPDVASAFTVSAWVRLSAYTQAVDKRWTTIVSTEASGGWEVNVDHLDPEPTLHFGFWKGPGTGDYVGHSCAGIALGAWTQIVGVVDPSMAPATVLFVVYVNGEQCFKDTTPNRIVPGSATLTIGQWPAGGRFLIGDVDDIAVWGRALVPEEVALLTLSPPPPPPAASGPAP